MESAAITSVAPRLSLLDYATANTAAAQPHESMVSLFNNAFQYTPSASVAPVFGTRVISHEGRDIFEVLWSTEVTVAKELKKVVIEDVRHIELNCQPT
jgi:hypothetical protein